MFCSYTLVEGDSNKFFLFIYIFFYLKVVTFFFKKRKESRAAMAVSPSGNDYRRVAYHEAAYRRVVIMVRLPLHADVVAPSTRQLPILHPWPKTLHRYPPPNPPSTMAYDRPSCACCANWQTAAHLHKPSTLWPYFETFFF